MSEQDAVTATQMPHTRQSLADDLQALGMAAGQTVIVHSSLRQIGWVVGGAVAVVQALLDVLGESGTLMVPTFSSGNSDPAKWENPPVPESWWQIIRDHMPAYDPQTTPTRQMGAIADTVRSWHGARRSNHPQASFAAVGANRDVLLRDEAPLDNCFGEVSPLARLYDLDGCVLLLGVGYGNNTSLHLAEGRADFPRGRIQDGSAVLVDGERRWVAFEYGEETDEDFVAIGAAFEAAHPQAVTTGNVGNAGTRLIRQRPLVDFGAGWLEANRK